MIQKVVIRNYRSLRRLDVDLLPGINIVVGDNETGKSTLIEAINLALTGRIHGRPFAQELTPYLVNSGATRDYVEQLNATPPSPPPSIIIEVYLNNVENAEILQGNNNLYGENACGIRLQAALSEDFLEEYKNYIARPDEVRLAPTEYYRVEWVGFSGNYVTARSVPAAVSVIDPTTIRMQSGIDHHLQHIIRTHLDPKERVELSREYRNLRENFSEREAVKAVNAKLSADSGSLTDRDFSLGVDISQRYTWESSLIAHLDDIPFPYIGKGEQSALKTLLAITQRADEAHVVLIEEPENHLSFPSLRRLIARIEEHCGGKQVLIATHSTYVLNKLGLQHLLLLSTDTCVRLTDIPKGTAEYFKKLAGYDTLRLVLAKAAILVEGPSDELIVQRAYKDAKGKLPIADGIDVISVGTAHKRFLDLAIRLNKRVWAVIDNDGKTPEELRSRFAAYLDHESVSLHPGEDPQLPSLEPQIAAANSVELLNSVFGKNFSSQAEVAEWMRGDKTSAALAIFESDLEVAMPKYIRDVVE